MPDVGRQEERQEEQAFVLGYRHRETQGVAREQTQEKWTALVTQPPMMS
ncbi:hypothetical protein [Streptomyces lydicus]